MKTLETRSRGRARGVRYLRRCGALFLACLSLALVACTSVPKSSAGFVVLESSKFT
jgi:hypothetical protein